MNALRMGLSGSYAAAIILGLVSGSAMAHEDSEKPAENLPPHKTPHTAEPPPSGGDRGGRAPRPAPRPGNNSSRLCQF